MLRNCCFKLATLKFYHKISLLSITKREKIRGDKKDFVFYRDFAIKVLTKLKKLDIIIGQITKPRSVLYGEVLKWWRGAPAKGVGRATGAKVQILSSPPRKNSVELFQLSFFFIHCESNGISSDRVGISSPKVYIISHRLYFLSQWWYTTLCVGDILAFYEISSQKADDIHATGVIGI